MKACLLLVFVLAGVDTCLAQFGSDPVHRDGSLPKDKQIFVLPPGSYWFQQPWRDSVYAFPQFQEGEIVLQNGYAPSVHPLMNYSYFLEMFVIKTEKGEIIPLTNNEEINYVRIGGRKFIYSRAFGHLEIILEGRTSVAEKTFIQVRFELSDGVKTPLSVSDNRTALAKSPRYYWPEKQYFIITDNVHVYRASPAVLPKIFPKEKKTIRAFEKTNKIDYKKKDDLVKIVLFCNREL